MYAILRCLPELAAFELLTAAFEVELELELDDPHAASSSAVAPTVTTPTIHPPESNRVVLLICGSPSSTSATAYRSHGPDELPCQT
jgi:hypothetical protein